MHVCSGQRSPIFSPFFDTLKARVLTAFLLFLFLHCTAEHEKSDVTALNPSAFTAAGVLQRTQTTRRCARTTRPQSVGGPTRTQVLARGYPRMSHPTGAKSVAGVGETPVPPISRFPWLRRAPASPPPWEPTTAWNRLAQGPHSLSSTRWARLRWSPSPTPRRRRLLLLARCEFQTSTVLRSTRWRRAWTSLTRPPRCMSLPCEGSPIRPIACSVWLLSPSRNIPILR